MPTSLALTALTFGMGANIATFSVVHALLLASAASEQSGMSHAAETSTARGLERRRCRCRITCPVPIDTRRLLASAGLPQGFLLSLLLNKVSAKRAVKHRGASVGRRRGLPEVRGSEFIRAQTDTHWARDPHLPQALHPKQCPGLKKTLDKVSRGS
jgi:hypothetical protein